MRLPSLSLPRLPRRSLLLLRLRLEPWESAAVPREVLPVELLRELVQELLMGMQ